MRRLISVPVLALVLSCGGAFAQQQQSSSDPYASPPPPPQAPSTQPDKGCSGQATRGDKGPWKASSTCPPPAKPGDTSASQPAADSAQQPKKSTADDNPFPEDISKRAEDEAKARDAAAAKPAPTATAGESSSRDKLDNLDLEGDRDSRVADGAGGMVHDPKLAADDIHVGQFYLNREDYKGAYARFKEATQADPENPDAGVLPGRGGATHEPQGRGGAELPALSGGSAGRPESQGCAQGAARADGFSETLTR